MRRICLIGMMLLLPAMAAGQGIYLDHVDGLNGAGGISDGATLTFHMRLINTYPYAVGGVDNGFWFHSDGLTWGSVTGDWNPAYCWSPLQVPSCAPPYVFDYGAFIKELGDTVGFGGINLLSGTGIVSGFDDIAYTITLGPIQANDGTFLTLDSCKYDVNPWCWSVSLVGEVLCNWGGPYTFFAIPDMRCTYIEPDPIYLNDITERTVDVYIIPWWCGVHDVDDIDLQTIRINGKIPPYTEARIENGIVIVDVFLMRLVSLYRPITVSGLYNYFVSFSTYSGDMHQFEGRVEIVLTDGDVTLDGKTDIDDVNFLVDYLWRGGPPCLLEEMMDVNKNGQVNSADVAALQSLVF